MVTENKRRGNVLWVELYGDAPEAVRKEAARKFRDTLLRLWQTLQLLWKFKEKHVLRPEEGKAMIILTKPIFIILLNSNSVMNKYQSLDISKFLPHRAPFLMVDNVLSIDDEHVTTSFRIMEESTRTETIVETPLVHFVSG